MTLRVCTIVVLSSLFLFGCSNRDGGHQDLQDYVEKVAQRPKRPIKDLPKFTPYDPYIYDAYDMRSPFAAEKEQSLVGHPEAHRPLQDLELYPLSALVMTGTLSDHDTLWALIEAPNGSLHKVAVGDYMGRSYAKVMKINADSVVLETSSPGPDGKSWVKREITLPLQKGRLVVKK